MSPRGPRCPTHQRHKETPRNYPDTEEGALAYLLADCSCVQTGAEAIPDPYVHGVWKILTPDDPSTEFAIVYLQGYREPSGHTRRSDDFETIDR